MRALYDRYHAIKCMCNINSQEGSSLQREDMSDLAGALATVNLPLSDHMEVSWIIMR